jgi:hypothetical protein
MSTKRKPPRPKKRGAYDTFGSWDAVRNAYRRMRRVQYFILTDAAAKRLDPVCSVCGKHLSEQPKGYTDGSIIGTWQQNYANRCRYDPRSKTIVVMHYECAWHDLFQTVCKLADRL